jgi:hypothetical protein
MNFARVALAAVVAWVVSIPIGFVVNEILLKDMMVANAAAMRPNDAIMANLPLGFGFTLVGFFAFAYAFAKGYEGGNGTMEGIRFGVLVAIMLQCFAGIWMFIVFPITGSMAVAGLVDGIVEFALYGAIVGTIYKPVTAPAKHAAAL